MRKGATTKCHGERDARAAGETREGQAKDARLRQRTDSVGAFIAKLRIGMRHIRSNRR